MSARADAVRPFAARPAVPVAATAGLGILLLVGRQLTASPPTLLLVLIAVGALSVWPTVRALDPPALRTGVAIGVGVALVAVAAGVQGPRIPAPTVAWVLPLGLVAAVAEEALFRRLIYGGLRRWGVAVAIIGSAVLFAALHVPMYGLPAFWVDLGAGLLFGWQRWASGSWAAPAATHAVANLLAVLR